MAGGIAIGISLLAGVTFGIRGVLLLVPAVMLLSLFRPGRARALLIIVMACLLLGSARAGSGSVTGASSVPDGSTEARGVVASLPVAGGDFERAVLRLERVKLADGRWVDVTGDVVVFLPDQRDGLSWRDTITVSWRFQPVAELAPGFGSWVRGQGAMGSARVYAYTLDRAGPATFEWLSGARRSVSRALTTSLPGDPGALASGFVTGDDAGLSDGAESAFRKTGTAHLTSVSGQNVALLAGFLTLWMRPHGAIRRTVFHVVLLAVIWSYVVMVGLEPPALRAAVVASLTVIGAYSGRRPDPLTLLALTLGVMAMIDPRMPHSVGFWLSASASLALCSVMMPEAPVGFRARMLNVVMASFAASLATLPILIWTFHEWSPITPLANALLTPLMTVLFPVVYLYAGVALLPTPLASLVSWIPGIGLDATLSIVERLAGIAPRFLFDGDGTLAATLIAVPCILAIALMSREGDRWIRVASRAF